MKIIKYIKGFLFGRYKLRIEKNMPKTEEEKLRYLVEKIIDTIDYTTSNNVGVKSFSIYYDYSHHKERSIDFCFRNAKLEYLWETETENPNYKEQ
jgi:hypothetical protein